MGMDAWRATRSLQAPLRFTRYFPDPKRVWSSTTGEGQVWIGVSRNLYDFAACASQSGSSTIKQKIFCKVRLTANYTYACRQFDHVTERKTLRSHLRKIGFNFVNVLSFIRLVWSGNQRGQN